MEFTIIYFLERVTGDEGKAIAGTHNRDNPGYTIGGTFTADVRGPLGAVNDHIRTGEWLLGRVEIALALELDEA